MWEYLRTKIVEVIKAQITLVDPDHVYRTERSKYDGYPAVVVAPSDNEADYHDSALQKETYIFTVRFYQTIADIGQDQADITLEKVVDQFLEVFRDRTVLGESGEPDRVDWVEPVPSRWGYEGNTEIGIKRFAEVKLRCRTHRR